MRLTRRILEAITTMANQIEAAGLDAVEAYKGKEREAMFNAMMDAGSWARQQLRKRHRREQNRLILSSKRKEEE